MRRNKNKYGYNFPFQVLPFNQPKNIPIGSTLIEYGSMKLKIEHVFIFVTPPLCQKKILRFDPTLGSNNSGLKNYRIKNHHIFGIARTSAFIWHIWIPLKKICNGPRLRLHSFGPLWTISTGNQWEISEVGRLSCFIEFFCLISHYL